MITAWLSRYMLEVIAALLVALLIATGIAWGYRGERNSARGDLRLEEVKVSLLEDANKAWAASAEKQNAAVARLQLDAAKREQAGEQKAAAADTAARPLEVKAAKIAAIKLSPPGAPPDQECRDLRSVIAEARQ